MVAKGSKRRLSLSSLLVAAGNKEEGEEKMKEREGEGVFIYEGGNDCKFDF